MTISCLIVDDEPPAIRVLEKYVDRIPVLTLAGSCEDAFEAGRFLQEHPVDLLFLDINLPELSGITFVKTLPDPPLVIFTTAYPEFAVQGFELAATDYLVKPIAFERFLQAVNRASALLRQKKNPFVQAPAPARPVVVRADRKLFRLDPQEILYLEAYGDYVKIVTRQGNITPKTTLQELEDQLPEELFLRVHRSFLVAVPAIRYLEGNFLRIGEENIPIGQTYREQVLERLQKR